MSRLGSPCATISSFCPGGGGTRSLLLGPTRDFRRWLARTRGFGCARANQSCTHCCMATKQISHTFDCDVDTYWRKFFLDQDFNRQLFIERLGFSRWVLVSDQETSDGLERVVEATPSTKDIPGPLKKALQNGLGYREEGVWSRSKSLYTVRVTPASLPDQIEISGEMRVTPEGSGCRRTYDAFVNARIFLVGGLLEGRLLADVGASYDEAAAFSREWLRQGK